MRGITFANLGITILIGLAMLCDAGTVTTCNALRKSGHINASVKEKVENIFVKLSTIHQNVRDEVLPQECRQIQQSFRVPTNETKEELYVINMIVNGKLILEALSTIAEERRCFTDDAERKSLKLSLNYLLEKFNLELRSFAQHCVHTITRHSGTSRRVCVKNAGRYLRLAAIARSVAQKHLWRHHHRRGHERFLTCQSIT